jgi:RHS repeat-associated protein
VYYLGTVEKWLKPNGRYEWRRDLAGVAQYTHIMNSSHAQTSLVKRYAYKDALGSLVMMTDDLGNLLPGGLDMNYTPWGERALANDWSYAQTGNFLGTTWALLFPSNKGFTGHEMLDNVGLIHMNGRIYDQRLQRFVQADPYIQNPGYSQSYNRYSYVMNNPLNRTDPSGYQCEGNGCIGNAWGSGGNYIIQIDNGPGGYTPGGWSHCTGCLSTYTPGYSSLGQADLSLSLLSWSYDQGRGVLFNPNGREIKISAINAQNVLRQQEAYKIYGGKLYNQLGSAPMNGVLRQGANKAGLLVGGFASRDFARMLIYSSLPYGNTIKNEWGAFIAQDSGGLYWISSSFEGDSGQVNWTDYVENMGDWLSAGSDLRVVELAHTHPGDPKEYGKFSWSGDKRSSDVRTAEDFNVDVSMRSGNHVRIYEPSVMEPPPNKYGMYSNAKGRLLW